MSVKNRLLGWLATKLAAQADLTTIDKLDENDVADLKIVARLFEVVDRKPVFTDALSHVKNSLIEHISDRVVFSVLFRILASSLFTEVANEYDKVGYGEEADQARRLSGG